MNFIRTRKSRRVIEKPQELSMRSVILFSGRLYVGDQFGRF